MKLIKIILPLLLTLINCPLSGIAHQHVEVMDSTAQENDIKVLVNQVAYNTKSNKEAIIKSDKIFPTKLAFQVQNTANDRIVFTGIIKKAEQVKDWSGEISYRKLDFSSFQKPGTYRIVFEFQQKQYASPTFKIGDDELAKIAFPAIASFFYHQRANSRQEQEADKHVKLYGSEKTVDLRGGWCDASGDVSKYFSHLAYTNFMLPQQIPMVTWAMVNTVENVPSFLKDINAKENYTKEALYGADYLMRSLSPDGYFYMTVFSYFDKDPNARRIVGLLADSKTTADYQAAYREGGGMAIAALARISKWNLGGDFTAKQYLATAERAFDHLQKFSLNYDDDGKNNIIDDYCALMAATELWKATQKLIYQNEARKRAEHLNERLSTEGYFIADDDRRPFWHAADAGLPIVALVRYLDEETNHTYREKALKSIKSFLDFQLKINQETANPFDYARQVFNFNGNNKHGFFIPHENESGWWWQGEDARLASLATAVILGGRLVYPDKNGALGIKSSLAAFAFHQIDWILGRNPYNMCMMYGQGTNNVPYMASMYGHGTGIGGISNGITGKDGNPDGSGIDFKVEDNGNEWRWSEQWIPHTGWFLQAVTAITNKDFDDKK
ncbi:hypothetical protein ACVWYG_002820 [Pedobacter sp. UYEF25]